MLKKITTKTKKKQKLVPKAKKPKVRMRSERKMILALNLVWRKLISGHFLLEVLMLAIAVQDQLVVLIRRTEEAAETRDLHLPGNSGSIAHAM